MLHKNNRFFERRKFCLAALLAAGLVFVSACGTNSKKGEDFSSYLGEYSYDSSMSAMVYEDMGGEGEGIQYRKVTDYDKLIAYAPIPVCLYFYAGLSSDTSGITAGIEQMAEDYRDRILFVSIDAQQETELAAHFEIEALPDFVLLDKGAWTASFSSYEGKTWTTADLEKWVAANSGVS